MTGLEAVWELDALKEAVFDLCRDLGAQEQPQDELMALRLKIRGLTARMSVLTSVVMSIFDNDRSTPELFWLVHGHEPEAAGAQGGLNG